MRLRILIHTDWQLHVAVREATLPNMTLNTVPTARTVVSMGSLDIMIPI